MRKIKFRAWHKEKKKMICPYALDFLHKTWVAHKDLYGSFDEIELMQFTGLYDKNGKEVYEGDIIKYTLGSKKFQLYHQLKTDVVYCNGHFNPFTSSDIIEFEIIGNIYENKDLLGGILNA